MSELNECSYCRYRDMRQVAEARGRFLEVREGKGSLGGVNIYSVPNDSRKYDLTEGAEDHEKYFKAWFQALCDHCVC